MKNKIITFSILFVLFLMFIVAFSFKKEIPEHKILKILDSDGFYIDLNDNNKIDNDELFKLKNIKVFSSKKPYDIDEICAKLNISQEDYLKNGLLAENFLKDNFLFKNVKIISKIEKYNSNFKYRYVTIEYNNEDVAVILLKNGLAYNYNGSINSDYLQYQNIKQIKLNSKELSKLDFCIVNLNNKIIHSLNSEHAAILKNAKLYLVNKLDIENPVYCGFCFKNKNNKDYKSNKKDFFKLNFKNVYKKSIHKVFGDIEIYLLNPVEYNKPGLNLRTDYSKRLIKEINNSKKSIYFALFSFSSQNEIFNALKQAKARNVEIKCVMQKPDLKDLSQQNDKIIKEFGCSVNKSNVIMHNKFFIFDNKLVSTGSVNITPSGSGGYNENIALFLNSKEIASDYLQEFNQLYKNKFSKNKTFFETKEYKIGNSSVRTYFSPLNNSKQAIINEIKKSKEEILISAFYLTDYDIINELISARKRQIRVLIILDSLSATNFKPRVNLLRNSGILLKVENWGGKNHEKTILIDKNILITGSCNFSKSGFEKNDENVLIIKNSEIAKFYRDYFLYLFNSLDKKLLYKIPRAESFESVNSCYDGIDNNFDGKIDSEDDGCK